LPKIEKPPHLQGSARQIAVDLRPIGDPRYVVPYAPAFDLHLIGVYDSQRESQAPASRADFRSVARMVTAAASATTLLRGGDDPVLSLAVPAVQR
jgi:hypothetical protein